MASSRKLEVKSELLKLLLCTTYALNKSSTKRLCVGLEYTNGYYREVVKLLSSSTFYKSVTFDSVSWEMFKDNFDGISDYFQNPYAFYQSFGASNKISLPNHDLTFTSSYGSKSISIDERPILEESQQFEDENEKEEQKEAATATPCKKIKTNGNLQAIVMMHSTFEGLRHLSSLVDTILNSLKEQAGLVNRTIDLIVEYLKDKLANEEPAEAMRIVNDFKKFKRFYSLHHSSLEDYIKEKIPDDNCNYKNYFLRITLCEILAFSLSTIAKDLSYCVF